jgi:hypothetical protein
MEDLSTSTLCMCVCVCVCEREREFMYAILENSPSSAEHNRTHLNYIRVPISSCSMHGVRSSLSKEKLAECFLGY